MQILLTNDDGIYAEGIFALYQELKKVGQVTVAAPDSERSSVGHGITLAHPIWYKKVRRKDRFFGYGISGTPADCVKFAVNVLLKRKPDLVISGINLGANDGCSVFYSGTVAGARESALMGISSMAVSLATFTDPEFKPAARYAARLAKAVLKSGIPKGSFLNVNVPNLSLKQIKGVTCTRQGTVPIHGAFHKRFDPNLKEYYWLTGKAPVHKNDNSVDTYALNNGYVTVTPVQSDTTDYQFLGQLRKWDI